MFEEVAKTIRAQLHDRASSPLFGSFAIAWVGWNYRFVLALLSELPLAQKLAYVDQVLYPDLQHHVLQGLLLPLLTALAFVFIYPWPARKVFEFWRVQQKLTKELQQRIDDETPLTREESRKIRQEVIDASVRYEAQIQQLAAENARLRDATSALSAVPLAVAREEKEDPEERHLTNEELEVLAEVAKSGSQYVLDKQLAKSLGLDAQHFEYLIGELLEAGYVDASYTGDGRSLKAKQMGLRYLARNHQQS